MPFEPIHTNKISDSVVLQIEQLILRGILRPGERLPSERELADRMQVSRPSLRAAIAELQDKGLLQARAGSGVYVADVLGSAFSEALIGLFANHDEAVFDYLDFRSDLEGMAAERAARQASEADIEVIRAILTKMEAAHSDDRHRDEAMLDAEFHMAILEASHNVVLLHMMRSMFDMLKGGVFYNRQRIFEQTAATADLLDQHRAIFAAIQNRDPIRAQDAVRTHLAYVRQALSDRKRSERNAEFARRRLDQEQARK